MSVEEQIRELVFDLAVPQWTRIGEAWIDLRWIAAIEHHDDGSADVLVPGGRIHLDAEKSGKLKELLGGQVRDIEWLLHPTNKPFMRPN